MSIPRKLSTASIAFLAMTAAAAAWPAEVMTDLNMRAGPGTNHGVVMVMPGGAIVDVRGCQANWCEVAYANRIGFASSNFLSQIETRPAPPPGPPPIFRPPPPAWGGQQRPPRRGICDERGARWAIGRQAEPRIVERARRDANAATARVYRRGDPVTQDLRRDRLNVEVNRRDRIVNLRCG